MRRISGIFLLCAATASAGDPRGSVVGVQARITIEMSFQGRSVARPVQIRQIGVVIGANGLILTAALSVDAQGVRVFLPGSAEGVDAEVLETDESCALIRAEGVEFPAADFAREWEPKVGDRVTWVGLLGGPAGRWSLVAKEATIDAALGNEAGGGTDYYSDPPFHGPVASRSALVLDAAGRAVGLVLTRPAEEMEGAPGGRGGPMGGLPLIRPASAFAQFLEGAAEKRGALGIAAEPLPEKVAEALGLAGVKGVIVTEVTPGSGAERAGLLTQDVLRSLDGVPVGTTAALRAALRGKPEGTVVEVEGVRVGEEGPKPFRLPVTLGPPEEEGSKERWRAARFGFTAEPLTPALRRLRNLPADLAGLHVPRVRAGGPAALGRPTPLLRGDVLLKVGETPVPDLAALKAALEAAPDGKPVTLFIRRGTETGFVEVTPETAAD